MSDEPGPEEVMLAAYPNVRAIAHRIGGERGDDLAQDAWLRVWIVRHRYVVADLPKILTAAVYHTWTDWGRAIIRHRETPIPGAWLAGQTTRESGSLPEALTYRLSPEQIVVLADERARVREMVAGLTTTDRDALVCFYWQETVQNDVGPAFKSRVQRARARFREQWLAAA